MDPERETAVPGAAFYTVGDSRYFLALVALLNSLRLCGHREPLVVLDTGLVPRDRELLAPHVDLVPAPEAASPLLLKSEAPLARPTATPVLIDADMIVVRSLEPLLAEAAAGSVVAFADPLRERFFPEWGELLGLGPLERRPYLNSGFLALPEPLATHLLELVRSSGGTIDLARTGRAVSGTERRTPGYPFRFLDQDVWNAVLAARTGPDAVVVLEAGLAPFPPFPGLRLVDGTALGCRYGDGTAPYVLHYAGRHKPWLHRTRPNVYSRLLTRLLLGPDVLVKVEAARLPRRLAPGPVGWAARRDGELAELARGARRRVRVRSRLAARRRRAGAA